MCNTTAIIKTLYVAANRKRGRTYNFIWFTWFGLTYATLPNKWQAVIQTEWDVAIFLQTLD